MNRQFFFISGVILIIVLLTTLILRNYQPVQSVDDFSRRQAIISQNGVYSQLGRAYACRASGDYDNSERLLCRILENDHKNIYALIMLADILFSQQRYEEAANCYSTLSAIAPNTVPTLTNYAISLAMQKKFPEAKEQLERALLIEPQSILLHQHMAAVEASLGNRDAAQIHLNFVRQAAQTHGIAAEFPYFKVLYDASMQAEKLP